MSLEALRARLHTTVLGSENAAELLLTALLARGHVLIEGAPGIGKTSLASTLAKSMGGIFKRVQFTPDLLPADLLGYSLYRMNQGDFQFIPGPVFAHCVLADEINRTSPRVQSALLECMSEQQVTLDGVTHQLPSPFLVIATQNDVHATGTFPLPEPQLDRFLLSIHMELPSNEVQTAILLGHARGQIKSTEADTLLGPEEIIALQEQVDAVFLHERVAAYITALADTLRRMSGSEDCVSVRALLNLMQAAKAKAFLEGQKEVHPDHVQALFTAVMRHRMQLEDGSDPRLLIDAALEQTSVP